MSTDNPSSQPPAENSETGHPLDRPPPAEDSDPPSVPLALPVERALREPIIPFALAVESEEILQALPVSQLPHPGFWWAVLWTLGYFLVINGIGICAGAIWAVTQLVLADDRQMFQHRLRTEGARGLGIERILLPVSAVSSVIMLALTLLIVRLLIGRDWKRRLALRRPGISQFLLAVLGLPSLIYVSSGVYALAKQVLPGWGYQAGVLKILDTWPVWAGVLAIGLGPGICEELWCRGFLGRGLVARYGVVVGVLMTSMFFGIMHLDPPHVVATAVMGILLHYSYLMTRSLWVPMLLHFLNNSAAVLVRMIPELSKLDETGAETPILVYMAALALLAAVSWALYRSRPYLLTLNEGGPGPWRPKFPGVEHPPLGCGTVLVHPWPGWLATALVAVVFTGFVLVISYS